MRTVNSSPFRGTKLIRASQLVVLLLLLQSAAALADTLAWKGTASGNWSAAANWTNLTAGGTHTTPQNGDTVVFNAANSTGTLATTNDLSIVGINLQIQNTPGAVSIAGTLSLVALTLTGQDLTVTADITLVTPQTWDIAGRALTVNGTVSNNNNNLKLTATTGTTTINGSVVGSGQLTVSGGTVALTNDFNSFGSGNVPLLINGGGTLKAATDGALGGGANAIAIGDAATCGTLSYGGPTATTLRNIVLGSLAGQTAANSNTINISTAGSVLSVLGNVTGGPLPTNVGLHITGPGTLSLENPTITNVTVNPPVGNTFLGDVLTDGGGLQVIGDNNTANSADPSRAGFGVKNLIFDNGGRFSVINVNCDPQAAPNTKSFVIAAGGGTFNIPTGRQFFLNDAGQMGAGSGVLTVQGGGQVLLAGALTNNAHTGDIVVDGGILNVVGQGNANPTFLGPNAKSITLQNGGRFQVASAVFDPSAGTKSFIIGTGGGIFEVVTGSAFLNDANQLTGSGLLTKAGPGPLNIANGNYTSPTVNVIGGNLGFSAGNPFNNSGPVAINLQGGNFSMAADATILVASNYTVNIFTNAALQSDRQASGGGVAHFFAGPLNIMGNVAVTLARGPLNTGNGNFNAVGPITITGNTTFIQSNLAGAQLGGLGTTTANAAGTNGISGTGNVTFSGNGGLTVLCGPGAYSGGTNITSNGNVKIYHPTAFGSGALNTVTVSSGGRLEDSAIGADLSRVSMLSGSFFRIGDTQGPGPGGIAPIALGPITFEFVTLTLTPFGGGFGGTAGITLPNGSTIKNVSTVNNRVYAYAGNITLNGMVAVDHATQGTGTSSENLSGVIQGTGGLQVSVGNQQFILSGSNTYTGPTVVTGTGNLSLNGTSQSSGVTVNSGGTFGGTGTIKALNVGAGGTLTPGFNPIGGAINPGTLNVQGNVIIGANATIALDIGAPGLNDQVVASSNVDLTGSRVTINKAAGFTAGTYTLVSANQTSATSLTGVPTLVQAGFIGSLSITGGNTLVLNVTNPATSFTWSGAGGDDNWSTPLNWVGAVAPIGNGTEDLIFTGALRLQPNNDMLNKSFSSISITANGFTLGGNAITLTGANAATSLNCTTGASAINMNLTVAGAAQTFSAGNGATLNIGALGANTIANGGFNLTLNASNTGTLNVNSAIGGTGGLIATGGQGATTTTLAGVNTFTGQIVVNGLLKLDGNTGTVAAVTGVTGGDIVVNAGGEFQITGAGTTNNPNRIANTANVVLNSGTFTLLSPDSNTHSEQFNNLTYSGPSTLNLITVPNGASVAQITLAASNPIRGAGGILTFNRSYTSAVAGNQANLYVTGAVAGASFPTVIVNETGLVSAPGRYAAGTAPVSGIVSAANTGLGSFVYVSAPNVALANWATNVGGANAWTSPNGGTTFPTTNDDVIISAGSSVALTAAQACKSLTFLPNPMAVNPIGTGETKSAITGTSALTVSSGTINVLPTAAATGTGLRGEYFAAANFSPSSFARLDPQVNIPNGTANDPDGAGTVLGVINYTMVWTGFISTPTSEPYTFFFNADDNVRVWVNNQLIIDEWTTQGVQANAGFQSNAISLQAGVKYPIRIEFCQVGGGSAAILSWVSAGTAKGVVPATAFFPGSGACSIANPIVIPAATTALIANNGGGPLALTGVISGNSAAGSMEFTGGGSSTIALGAANTFTAPSSISNVFMQLGNNAALSTTAVTINSGSIGANYGSLAATIALANALNLNGDFFIGNSSNIFNLSGAVTLLKDVSIISCNDAGTAANTSINGVGTIMSGIISDGANTFSLTKRGSALLNLSGVNTYDGTTTVFRGTLRAGNAQAFGPAASASIIMSAQLASIDSLNLAAPTLGGNTNNVHNTTLDLNNQSITLAGLSTAPSTPNPNNVFIQSNIAGAPVLTVNNTANFTFGGIINNGTGTVSLVKGGTGTLTLNNANGYTGATTVNNGVLALGNNTALGSIIGATTVASGATLDLNSVFSPENVTVAGTGFAGANGVLVNSSSASAGLNGVLTLSGASTVHSNSGITLSNAVNGNLLLTKEGSGFLLANSTVAGGITANAGTLGGSAIVAGQVTLNNNTTFTPGSGPGIFTANGGLTFSAGPHALVFDLLQPNVPGGTGDDLAALNGSVLNLGGGATPATFAVVPGLGFSPGTYTLFSNFGAGSTTTPLPGPVTGLPIGFSGTVSVSGNNIVLSVSVAQITWNGSAGDHLWSNPLNWTPNTNLTTGGPFELNFPDNLASNDYLSVNDIAAGVTLLGVQIRSSTTPYVIGGSGQVTILSGGTTPNSAINNIAGDNSFNLPINLAVNPGTINIQAGSFGADGSINNGGVNLMVNTVGNSQALLNGLINGSGGLVKSGTGTLTLSGVNGFTGSEVFNAGIVKVGNGAALGTPTVVQVNANATLDVNGFFVPRALQVIGNGAAGTGGVLINSAGGPGAVTGTVQLLNNSSFAGTGDLTISGVLSGAFNVTKNGDNTLFLNGNNTFAGALIIAAGTVRAGNANALGDPAGSTTVQAGASLDLAGFSTLDTILLNGTGVNGGGALVNSSSGQSSIQGAVTLQSNATMNNTGNVSILGTLGGAFTLTKAGTGNLIVYGNNTVGGFNVTGGALVVGLHGAAVNPLGTGPITLAGGNLVLQGVAGAGNVNGLMGQFYTMNVAPNPTIANPNTSFANLTNLNTYLATLTVNATIASTTQGGKTDLNFGNNNGTASPFNGPNDAVHAAYGYATATNFNSRFTGYLYVPEAGNYLFGTSSDDGSVIFLDGNDTPVVNNNFYQGLTRRGSTVQNLTEGFHAFVLGFYQGTGNVTLTADYTPPGGAAPAIIPNAVLFTNNTVGTTQTYANNITVTADSSIIITNSLTAAVGNITVTGAKLTLSAGAGALLQANAVQLNGAATFDAAGVNVTSKSLASASTTSSFTLGAAVLTTGDATNTTYAGSISGTAGSLVKEGAGSLTLSGTNPSDYTGPTTINAGALVVNTSISASSAVTVAVGGTLRGTGIISSGVTTVDGTIFPGDTPNPNDAKGTLSVLDLAVSASGKVKMRASGSAANFQTDKLTIAGTNVTLAPGATLELRNALINGNYNANTTLITMPASNPLATSFTNVTVPNQNPGPSAGLRIDYLNNANVSRATPAPQTVPTAAAVVLSGNVNQVRLLLSNAVTPATVTSFEAGLQGAGVLLTWNCVSEYQNAGFNVYRGSGQKWTRVNAALIAGRISSPEFKSYRLYDWAAPGVYEYRLESVSIHGEKDWFGKTAGPLSVENAEAALSNNGLDAALSSISLATELDRGEALRAKFANARDGNVVKAVPIVEVRVLRVMNELPIPAEAITEYIELSGLSATAAVRSAETNDTLGAAFSSRSANNPSDTLSAGSRLFTNAQSRAGSYTGAKVTYRDAGVLLIPQNMLPAGFDINRVTIQREGRTLTPLAVTGDGLLVYAPGYQDDYTDKDALFLRKATARTTAGSAPHAQGLFASAQPVTSETPGAITVSYHDVYFDYNLRPLNYTPWFSSKYLTGGSMQSFTLDAPNARNAGASLTINLWSLSHAEGVSPDHALQVAVNGQPVGQAVWSGGDKMMQLTFQIGAGILNSGANQIDLLTPALPGVDTQIALLHSMTLACTRALDGARPVDAYNHSSQAKLFEVANLPVPSAWVVDARYPDRAALVAYETQAQPNGTYRLRFTANGGGTGRFLIVPAGQENLPLAITKRAIKPVKASAYLAVGPSQFERGVQPLLAQRAKEGIRGTFVDQEQIFDYYGYGRYGPAAIQSAVRSVRPQYLLLLGRTTYDYRNYSGQNVEPLCPTFLVSTTFWAQATSDSMFGDLGRGIPEVAVGRLPVNTAAELAGAVRHIIDYKGIPASALRVHAVADRADPTAGDFAAEANSLRQTRPDVTWQENYFGMTWQSPAEVTSAMKDAANGGADMLIYIGHGNAAHLGKDDPRLLDTNLVQEWTGNVVLLQSTCTANWMASDTDGYKSIAIQALTQPQGGISASIASSTYMNSTHSAEFMDQLLSNANKSGMRWGAALLQSQQWAARKGGGFYSDLSRTEQIFGDPAMPVLMKGSGTAPTPPGATKPPSVSAPGTF